MTRRLVRLVRTLCCQHRDYRRERDSSGRLTLVCLDCDRRVPAIKDDPRYEQIKADWLRSRQPETVPVKKHRKVKVKAQPAVTLVRKRGA